MMAVTDMPAAPPLRAAGPPPPLDGELPDLQRLFDADWVWGRYSDQFAPTEEPVDRLRLREFLYWPGERALAGYVGERRWGAWVLEEDFAVELRPNAEARLFRFPDDPYLPGLSAVASPAEAHPLISRYTGVHPQFLRVEVVRYHPSSRAVLRHTLGWRRGKVEGTLYARAMPPRRVARLVAAGELAGRSDFVLPRLAGCWEEGGVVWIAGTPGEPMRPLVRAGRGPAPDALLDALASLWSAPLPPDGGRPFDAAAAFAWARRVLTQVVTDEDASATLDRAVTRLQPFIASWGPSTLAHNDFYDDQLVLLPDGRLALVDFEETGPGDPLLDVGNMLAHLRWMAHFTGSQESEACAAYRDAVRRAALDRFGWHAADLALREAFALFRLATTPLRQPNPDWPQQIARGLALAIDALEPAA